MSVARVQYVKAARKDQGKCGKCGVALPKGSPYRWWTVGFRSRYVYKRCMKSECTPRTSELESSAMSEVYAARESAEEELAGMRQEPGDKDDVENVVHSYGEAVRERADAYREHDDTIGGGGYTESGEKADALESAADELEGWSADEDPADAQCDEHDEFTEGCDACDEARLQVWESLIDSAESVIADTDLGV